MKKNLLALAVIGAFAGTASAQSSVTIYGAIDLAISKGNGGTALNQGSNGTSKAFQVRQSHGSRLGFRGNEDLGGGLSAQFQIEHRFAPDTGGANTPFWFGRSYVQLTSAAAGSVYLGRDYMPAFYVALKSDPFGFDGVGQLGTVMYANYATNDRNGVTSGTNFTNAAGATSRTNNTIGYKSPNLGGLTVQVAGAASEGVPPAAGASTVGREYGANVEYSGGPIYAAVAFDKTQKGPAAFDGNSLVSAAFHYNFGFAKAMVYGAQAKTGLTDAKNKFYSVGLLAPIGPGNLKAVVGVFDPAGNNNKQGKVGLGYDYLLSKRTNVYADIGHARQNQASRNTTYAFGVKHTF